VGNRLFTMGARGEEEFLIALDAERGTELWATSGGAIYTEGHGNGPRSTPTVDGDLVFALGGKGLLVCAQVSDGQVRWKKSLVNDLGGSQPGWGYTESLLITGDLVLCTPGGSQGTLAALNKGSGEVVWRSKGLTDPAQYSSPILIEHAGKPQVVQLVMNKFFGVDPGNGETLWQQRWPGGRIAVIPTPIAHEGHIYITSGYNAGCTLAQLGDQSVKTLYSNKNMVNHHGGVVLVDDHLYGYSENAGWVCQKFHTGERVWASKALGKGAVHYADGMLYCVAEESGEVALVEATPKAWTQLGRFKLEPQSTKRRDGAVWTHPVVINGRLYLRDQELLFCFNVKV
jgi:outer membrane protein assembly factor BamB